MHGLTMAAVLQVAMLATSMNDYQTAYNRAEAASRPLLVLVGSENSTAFQDLKKDRIPELMRSGGLENVVVTEVEVSAKPDLSRQLLRGESLPQLVLYTPVTKDTWRRTHISGAPSERDIQAFLVREISKGIEVAAKSRSSAKAAKPASTSTTTTFSQFPDMQYSFPSGGS